MSNKFKTMHYVKNPDGSLTPYKKQELIKDKSLKGSYGRRSDADIKKLDEAQARLNRTLKLIQRGVIK